MSVRLRELPNGFLIAPQRGDPPEPPEGYERMHGEKYVFCPIVTDCKDRERRIIKTGCCSSGEKFYCHKEHNYVSRYHCKECQDA